MGSFDCSLLYGYAPTAIFKAKMNWGDENALRRMFGAVL
jgi:hypothetical protein